MKIQQRRIFLRRVEQDQPIPLLSFHSMDEGKTLTPIINLETVGQKPSEFSKDRSFWTFECMGSRKSNHENDNQSDCAE